MECSVFREILCSFSPMRVQTYSPDGKVYQLEYAQKAIDNGGFALSLYLACLRSRPELLAYARVMQHCGWHPLQGRRHSCAPTTLLPLILSHIEQTDHTPFNSPMRRALRRPSPLNSWLREVFAAYSP